MFCLLAGAAQIFAQSQASTGQITGVVTDATGAVVPNVSVTLTSKDTNQTQTATTSDDGVYRFVTLQPGTYTVKTSGGGFAETTADVEVQVGRTTDANFTLGAGGVAASVQVTAEAIQTTSSNFDSVQNSTAIENLPINGRRFQDFATLTPTAQVDPSRGQISLSGQRGINTVVNVDGADYTQPFFGGIRGGERSNSSFTIPQEAIGEFQVVAAGYAAEFGRSTGGIVNVVTKSGSNDFRGSAFYLIRPERFARGNDFTDALAAQRLNALNIEATLAPTQQQFGGSFGGPIFKDKLFFFTSYEQQKFKAPRTILFTNLFTVPTPTAAQTEAFNFYRGQETSYEATNDGLAALGRIDYNLNDNNRFNIRYNYSKNDALNNITTGESEIDPTRTRAISNQGTEADRNNTVVAQFFSNISPTLTNEFRYQFAREDRPRSSNSAVATLQTFIGEYGTRNFLPTTQFDARHQVTDSVTYLRGNHSFKFGGEFGNLYANQIFAQNQYGLYNFSGLNSTAGVLDAVSSTPAGTTRLGRFDTSTARYLQQIGNAFVNFHVQEFAVYGQDSWNVRRGLTLNFGLRFEKQFNPETQGNNTAVLDLVRNAAFPLRGGKGVDPIDIPDSQNEFGPRAGFAYDPTGKGKTVIRGFAGIYYARTPLLLLANGVADFRVPPANVSVQLGPGVFNAATFDQAKFNAANPDYVRIVGGTNFTPNTVFRQFAILGINLNSYQLSALPTLTPAQLQTIADRIQAARTAPAPALGVFQNANFTGISPNFKNPESYQFGGGFEQEIARNMYIGVDTSFVKTVFLQRNVDINLPAPLTPSEYVAYLQANNSAAIFGLLQTATNNFSGILATGRPIIGIAAPTGIPTSVRINNVNVDATVTRPRPIPTLGSIQLRDSSARSFFAAGTFRFRMTRKWGQVNAFYTLSRTESDDDNERDSGGVLYSNPYDLRSEYSASRLDRTHQFVANPVFFLPFGFEVSSAIRLLSGNPINTTVGSDLNGDGNSNDRPIIATPNVELRRNFYRNRAIYNVDLRAQKGFSFGERRRLVLSTEFFNIFGLSNLQIGGNNTTRYCSSTTDVTCGLNSITNPNFLNINEQVSTSSTFGQLNLTGVNPGTGVFQVQFGARFQF